MQVASSSYSGIEFQEGSLKNFFGTIRHISCQYDASSSAYFKQGSGTNSQVDNSLTWTHSQKPLQCSSECILLDCMMWLVKLHRFFFYERVF